MPDAALPLRVVDGLKLSEAHRDALRPGEEVTAAAGRTLRLPRYFYEVDSWERALEVRLSPHFGAFEFLDVDVREAEPLRLFPRYLPTAITAFAAVLERLREAVGDTVRVAANGGYRSPTHEMSQPSSPHVWGAAADIYRIGNQLLDNRERIERFAGVARQAMPGVWVRPAGDEPGLAFDHLHVDIGYMLAAPRAEHLEVHEEA